MITLVLGGINSGKSAFAEAIAGHSAAAHNGSGVVPGQRAVRYIATLLPVDGETRKKIELHKARRPATWLTSEPGDIELSDISGAASSLEEATVLLDSAGTLLSLYMDMGAYSEMGAASALSAAKAVHELAHKISLNPNVHDLVIVSEEAGQSLVSMDPSTRAYVSALGELNQKLASLSTEVYLVVAGQSLCLKKSDNGIRV